MDNPPAPSEPQAALSAGTPAGPAPLTPIQRRILGVLIEKAFCTPDVYPMTVKALVAGCNQKNNRDPVSSYTEEPVEEALRGLQQAGWVTLINREGGRTDRWKHNLRDRLDLHGATNNVAVAVLAELFLRGPSTEGEIRARAGRMVPIATIEELGPVLRNLEGPGLVWRLPPEPGQRGTRVAHGFYASRERETLLAQARAAAALPAVEAAAPVVETLLASRPAAEPWRDEIQTFRTELAELRQTVEALSDQLRQLRQDLGA